MSSYHSAHRIRIDFLRLENSEDLEIRDEADEQFFVSAMLLIANKLDDLDTAHRLHKLLKKGKNGLLLTNSSSDQLFHTCYMRLMGNKLPTKEFMEHYRKITSVQTMKRG